MEKNGFRLGKLVNGELYKVFTKKNENEFEVLFYFDEGKPLVLPGSCNKQTPKAVLANESGFYQFDETDKTFSFAFSSDGHGLKYTIIQALPNYKSSDKSEPLESHYAGLLNRWVYWGLIQNITYHKSMIKQLLPQNQPKCRHVEYGLVFEHSFLSYLEAHACVMFWLQCHKLLKDKYALSEIDKARKEYTENHDSKLMRDMSLFILNQLPYFSLLSKLPCHRAHNLITIVSEIGKLLFLSSKDHLRDEPYPCDEINNDLVSVIETHFPAEEIEPIVFEAVFMKILEDVKTRVKNMYEEIDYQMLTAQSYMDHTARTVECLFARVLDFATPDVLKKMNIDRFALYGGCYDFESLYGITPNGDDGIFNPPADFVPFLYNEDCNGVTSVPRFGISSKGRKVRFDVRRHAWDKSEHYFVDQQKKETYKITEWTRVSNKDSMEHVKGRTYIVPDFGTDEHGKQVKYDARKHDWRKGDKFFSDQPVDLTELEQLQNEIDKYLKDPAKINKYTIKSYRKFTIAP